MKKFWNLMLAALVIFGAVACTENQEENIPEAKKEPVLSFVANIANDETRVDVQETDGVWTTVLEENETLILYGNDSEYEFTNADSDDKNVFTCYDEDVRKCVGKPVQIDNGYFDSKAGTKGSWIQADIDSFDPTAVITLVAQTSFFKFTSAHEVTLSASDNIFEVEGEGSVNSVTFAAGEDIMVAFLPLIGDEVTLSYSIDGVKCKEIKKEFEAKKVYNLGELKPFEAKESEWALVGAFSSWSDKKMSTTPDANVVVLKNVEMKAATGFLVRKPATEWADKYGAGSVNYIKSNHYIKTSKDGADMCLEADGKYDIYFNSSTKNLYVMVAGTDYAGATEQTVNGEEPTQEEPEVTDKVVYLKPNANWKVDNARFAAYFFGGSGGEKWVSMTDVGDGIYEAHLPEGYDYGCNIIFCRMNPSTTANNWNNKWNQTSDLKTPTDGNNLYTVKDGTWDKGGGAWSKK